MAIYIVPIKFLFREVRLLEDSIVSLTGLLKTVRNAPKISSNTDKMTARLARCFSIR